MGKYLPNIYLNRRIIPEYTNINKEISNSDGQCAKDVHRYITIIYKQMAAWKYAKYHLSLEKRKLKHRDILLGSTEIKKEFKVAISKASEEVRPKFINCWIINVKQAKSFAR